jgi:predicted branched-subunit amino acid permease
MTDEAEPATELSGERPGSSSRGSLLLLTAAVVLFGVAYGADSVTAGGGILRPVLTSLFVNGGASQIASEGVLRGHGTVLIAIVVGLALNLRFMALALLISADLPTGRILRLISIYLISDIPVGLAIATPAGPKRRRVYLEVGVLAAAAWVVGTLVGTLLGNTFDVSALGADGAIAGAFVALALGNIRNRRSILIAVVSFGVTLALMTVMDAGFAVLCGAAAALVVEAFTRPIVAPVAGLAESS